MEMTSSMHLNVFLQVLLLAEKLHAVSSRFDRFRSERYQQAMVREEARRQPVWTAGTPASSMCGSRGAGVFGIQSVSNCSANLGLPQYILLMCIGVVAFRAACSVFQFMFNHFVTDWVTGSVRLYHSYQHFCCFCRIISFSA